MAYLASPSTSTVSVPQRSLLPLLQQTSWIREYRRDTTAVTTLPKSTEALHEPLKQSAYESSSVEDLQWPWEQLSNFSEVSLNLSKAIRIWYEKGTSATLLFEAQLQRLERHYVFRGDIKVQHFLRKYPFLVQLLANIYSKIEAHFPGSQVLLDVAVDYEATDNYTDMIDSNEELVISIYTHLPPKEAIETLEKFYDDWWLKASKEARGKISIGLEFL